MKNFVDYHCHLLPGVDDGSTDRQESLSMARILSGFGFSTVHCTPHRIKGYYDNEPVRVQAATRYLQRAIHEEGIPLHLVASTEHYLDEYLVDQMGDALSTGRSRYLLVEAPMMSGGEMLPAMVSGVRARGMVPLIAHPERCSVFEPARGEKGRGGFSFFLGKQRHVDLQGSLVMSLLGSGCRFQGNIGSFAGIYGSEIKQRAVLFLKEGIYSCVGSDAHRSERLKAMLEAGMETVVATVGEEAAKELFSGAALT